MLPIQLLQLVKTIGWFIALFVFSLLISVGIFFYTVSFLDPMYRFALTFMLNVLLIHHFVGQIDVLKRARLFLVLAPPIVCLILFLALGIMQQIN
jgi:hypothetical protein